MINFAIGYACGTAITLALCFRTFTIKENLVVRTYENAKDPDRR